ncbi:DNA repair protein RecO [Oceanobacillus chungangensis]|uniref:DNA repair protein RecO n=1 Tax=Oceanobacillus chungangensis TaxID=1229152 RepID=A0A3D8Q0L3_9BACI|nr:DNA repair protein RecO [Oceanobacillus chungangensis]RDW21773.1 DNA repair protein RecO [Oceanobacillus chungangensis]
MLEKIDGIVLKTQDYGESHKIITVYSKKLGKFTALAKGAKKPKSRMAAVTQPFIYAQFFVYVNKGLSTIQQGEIIESFRPIREDIIMTAYTAYIMELTDKLLDSQVPDVYLFEQLFGTLNWLVEHEGADVPIMMYELKLFKKGGFAPIVNQCSNCGSKELPFSFSIAEGGFLCRRCIHLDENAVPLPESLTKILYIFLNVGLERVGNISIKPDNLKLLRQILDAYYDKYGGYYLKSRKFLKQLDLLR